MKSKHCIGTKYLNYSTESEEGATFWFLAVVTKLLLDQITCLTLFASS